jgi:DNA-binding transcriptional MerR regulator
MTVSDHDARVDSEAPQGENEFTIDQLAARTGVPSRTIRFYQAKGVLPPPTRRGRVAFYDETHATRLKAVSELQDKGLRLRAIRDLILTPDSNSDTIQQWLGIGQKITNWVDDSPQLFTEEQLKELLGNPPPGTIARLRRHGGITVEGNGLATRYLVQSPALLKISALLEQAGISMDMALSFHEILEKHLRRCADEIVELAIKHIGKGFGKSSHPEDVSRAVESLYPTAPGGDAVRVIFAREIQRAVGEHLTHHVDVQKHRRR